MKATALIAVAVLLTSASVFAQAPSVENGTLAERAVSGTLEREFAAITAGLTGPAWVAYSVSVPVRGGDSSCWTTNGSYGARPSGAVKLEGPDRLLVLFRIADRRVERIQIASSQCPLDAGGLTLHWLTGVTTAASLDWLTRFTSGESARRLTSSAMVAIALHADPAAMERLMALARDSQDSRVRADALFWLGQRAGDKVAGVISDAIDRDPDTEVKKKAVFALSQMPKDEGVTRLIDVARNNRNAAVRRQAMFWLGQSRDPRALRYFEEVLGK